MPTISHSGLTTLTARASSRANYTRCQASHCPPNSTAPRSARASPVSRPMRAPQLTHAVRHPGTHATPSCRGVHAPHTRCSVAHVLNISSWEKAREHRGRVGGCKNRDADHGPPQLPPRHPRPPRFDAPCPRPRQSIASTVNVCFPSRTKRAASSPMRAAVKRSYRHRPSTSHAQRLHCRRIRTAA
ncbi:hypothetical protein B0H10DRAFT_533969 [Mycena sp. CBHHK59/15]|nr:hypothetical protein B0H10DRAFT_533969 [Mycena sp. CBHHK59/15]